MPRGGLDPRQRERLRKLFDAALELKASERPTFVDQACEGDPELKRPLQSLLKHSLETGSAFDRAMVEAIDFNDFLLVATQLVGRTLGHYLIVEKIGEGGMGEVYQATDTRLGRDVAIKIVPEAFTSDPERLTRFEREARVLASLNHPNIATIHGVEEAGGTRFLVLELIEGETLRSKLENGPLPLDTVTKYASQIAAGLAKAHAAGVVHRDLKPENLMLTQDGFVKILDFGIAKAAAERDSSHILGVQTAAGRIMGTASFMSPEQARSGEVDFRSDQFAFGAVLFEMATGERAFRGETDADSLVAVMHSEPEKPADYEERLPRPLRAVIERCLAKEPGDRYESTLDLMRELRHLSSLSGENLVPVVEEKPRRRFLPFAAASIVVVLALVTALWWLSQIGVGDRGAPPGEVTASIAVLPFENLGPESEEYFADGMTDALITHLSKIERLKVISSRAVMQYKGTQKPMPVIARELGVETLLTGTVLYSGDRVRISTQLIEAETNRNLWVESYERDLGDILVLQGEVARAVAGAVQVKIDPEEEARIATARTVDPDAHEAYLRGLEVLELAYEGTGNLQELFSAAVEHLRRAIELEPDWGQPYAKLARTYYWLAGVGGPKEQAEFFPKSKAAALKALELDDTLAEAHMALGSALLCREWNWDEAEQAYLRALELDPNHSSWAYGRFLKYAGRYDEAIEQYRRAMERYPTSQLLRVAVGGLHLFADRPGQAEAEAMRLIKAFPESYHGHWLLGQVFLSTARFEEAVAELEKVRDTSAAGIPLFTSQYLPIALAKAGRVDEARHMLREFETSGQDYWLADLYMVLGEPDKAMAQIEAAFEVHRDVIPTLPYSLEFDRLMEIPRFREIIEAVGFPNLKSYPRTPPAPA